MERRKAYERMDVGKYIMAYFSCLWLDLFLVSLIWLCLLIFFFFRNIFIVKVFKFLFFWSKFYCEKVYVISITTLGKSWAWFSSQFLEKKWSKLLWLRIVFFLSFATDAYFLHCSPFDYRPVIVQTGVLATTNGSARVRIGSTDLLIGVKAELINIESVALYRNRLNFFVDCSANATPLFAGMWRMCTRDHKH